MNKTETIKIRVTPEQKLLIKALANQVANGNISKLMLLVLGQIFEEAIFKGE